MTLGQSNLIKNFNSLKRQIDIYDSGEVNSLLLFCSLFNSDDPALYREYRAKALTLGGEISSDTLIKLYAKMHGLDPEKDIKKIMYFFLETAYNNGVSYHLTSSANVDSIMNVGLGAASLGEIFKTEERKDYERLVESIKNEGLEVGKVFPFHTDYDEEKTFFSNIPLNRTRYGDKPEWIKELALGISALPDNSRSKQMATLILNKYNIKYEGAKKVLLVLPLQGVKQLTEDDIEELLKEAPPKAVIEIFYSAITGGINNSTKNHIDSSNIIVVEGKDLYVLNESGELVNTEEESYQR